MRIQAFTSNPDCASKRTGTWVGQHDLRSPFHIEAAYSGLPFEAWKKWPRIMQTPRERLSDESSVTDLGRVVRAFGYTLNGLKFAWRNEAAFRQEIIAAVVLVPAAFYVGTSAVERLLLIGSVLAVLITELLNTSVEAIVDRFGGEIHPLSGAAKDLGSAAVFLSLVLAGCVWATFLWIRFT